MNEFDEWKELHKFHFNTPGYRTKDLAEYLGVSMKTIQRWLKGQYAPSTTQLAKIGQYLAEKKSS